MSDRCSSTVRRNPLERRRSRGNVEGVQSAGEVLVELACDGVEPTRSLEDARADSIGEVLQDLVVVLDFVCDADEAELGCGQQQGADRRVDGAVADVEDAVGLRGLDEAGVEADELGLIAGVCPFDVVDQIVVVCVHDVRPFGAEGCG